MDSIALPRHGEKARFRSRVAKPWRALAGRGGRSYLDTSWGWGLGAEAGVTPGFIRNSKPQYHTPGYVENYIRGPGYSLSGGVLFAGVTANHGNPSLCAHLSVCG